MDTSPAARRLRLALELFEVGESMYRQRVKREHPDASHQEIEMLVEAWRISRPGAEKGDSFGRPSTRFA